MLGGEGGGWGPGQRGGVSQSLISLRALRQHPSSCSSASQDVRAGTACTTKGSMCQTQNHQALCVSTWRLKCQNGPCQGSKHGELAGTGFVLMLVSSVGGTHLVCRAGDIPQGYSPRQVTSLMRMFSMNRSDPCQGETTLALLNKGREDCSRLA